MRVWDLLPGCLCKNHLLGEHAEIHAIWSIITKKKEGYSRHPEVERWRGKLKALYLRHDKLKMELEKRGYSHQSPLDVNLARGESRQEELIDSLQIQKELLRKKKCSCQV